MESTTETKQENELEDNLELEKASSDFENELYKHNKCLIASDTKNKLEIYKEKNQVKKVLCKYCDSYFKNDRALKCHSKYCIIKQLSDENNIDNLSDIESENELNAEKSESELIKHQITHVNNKRFRRKKCEIKSKFICDICNKQFTRKHDLKRHRDKLHKNAIKVTEEETASTQINSELLQKCKIINSGGKECYKCETCNKIIYLSYNFIRHQTVHTGIKPFVCHLCGKNFRISSGLSRHIREFHQKIKKYNCKICNKKFGAKSSLDDHHNIHTNLRPFVCDKCGKSFKQKASLHIHKMFHTNNLRFSCSVCGKKYLRARDLKVHNWLHSGYRPYSCKICGNMFRLSQGLKRHMKVHNKELVSGGFCDKCGAHFTQLRYLKKHKKTHELQDK